MRQVAAQVRLLSQMCLVELLTHSLGGGAVARNPLRQLGFLVVIRIVTSDSEINVPRCTCTDAVAELHRSLNT